MTKRLIDGVVYNCYDVGVDSFELARANRMRIKMKAFTAWWEEMELSLEHTKITDPLPSNVPFVCSLAPHYRLGDF